MGSTAAADPLACKLQFNSLRYLGFALAKREAFHECLDCLEKAIRIDKSDVTLYAGFYILDLYTEHNSRPQYNKENNSSVGST